MVATSLDDWLPALSFRREVRVIDPLWIPLSDGCRLAARVWLPTDAEADPVPAIVEYIPYRRRDFTAPRDALLHPYYAGHGYAAIRIDIRGSGDSDGIPMDEYIKREQDDALEVLQWIAEQPWCSGITGMIGISWGGFSALQVAARRPPSLKAIVTVCSTDDRYADDVHYMGGCLISNNLTWGGCMFGYMARPPDPVIVGERWRELWLERMKHAPSLVANWLEHQQRDQYWKHASVCEDYDQIRCAVYAVGGWADGYSNAIPRLMQHLNVPRKGLIGPWGHAYPHIAVPDPRVGFLQESLRWWDRWLKGIENGVEREPMLSIWMQGADPPASSYTERAGSWIRATSWPAPVSTKRLELNPGSLDADASDPQELLCCSPLITGVAAGEWCPHGIGPEMSPDQRVDDSRSLTFDSRPLAESITILGAPEMKLRLASDRCGGLVAVRLCVVSPNGESSRITYGLLNLTHRDSSSEPQELVPGERYTVMIKLNDVGQVIPKDHRLRVSVSNAYWPLAWPSAERTTLTIVAGECWLELPVYDGEIHDDTDSPFEVAVIPQPLALTWLRPVSRKRTVKRDLASGQISLTYIKDDGAFRIDETKLEVDAKGEEIHYITENDPLSAAGEAHWRFEHRRGDWQIAVEATTRLTATDEHFTVTAELEAFEGEQPFYERSLNCKIPRRLL
ncbi:MAG: CocE/NonD family hydrolase [Gammaproteobacteria bacterium]|nr:CocE/NonD family hydrolase [Gammaproteobacteria bacterium]